MITIISPPPKIITIIKGRQGPAGPPGTGTGAYQVSFTGASVVVTHNLGYRPNVTVLDTAGDQCDGTIVHNTINQLTLTFTASFSGTVYCS